MLHAMPRKKSWLTLNPPWAIVDGGVEVAEVKFDAFSGKAELLVDGLTYQACVKGFWSPAYVLELDGSVLAQAEKPKFLSSQHAITCAGGKRFSLKQPFLKHGYELLDGGQTVGRIFTEGFWGTTIVIDLPGEIPIPVQAFMFWLVRTFWDQDQQHNQTNHPGNAPG